MVSYLWDFVESTFTERPGKVVCPTKFKITNICSNK